MKKVEYEFCMKQFKPAIAALAILLVLVLGWTGWHCTRKQQNMNFALAAAVAPSAPPIRVKDKMLHPYWGNCNKCHLTTDAGNPVSRVMAGPPISIKDKMIHEYWGNCLLCHKVVDGIQPKNKPQVMAAALNRITSGTLGLKIQTVTAAMMQKLGLANEDGVMVLEVASNSIAESAGLRQGDEIIRMGKIRLDTTNDFEAALNGFKPGSVAKMKIYRGNKARNILMKLPKNLYGNIAPAAAAAPMTQNQIETLAEQLGVPKTQQDVTRALQRQQQAQRVAATAPMTQNQIETLAEQLGVPKTQQDVTRALQGQQQAQRLVASPYSGKVAVAVMGPGLGYQVSYQFGESPYFVIFDPALNNYKVLANPNANDLSGRGIQTGQYIVDSGVSNVIAGSFSPNALQTLHTLRVNVYSGVTGPAQAALGTYMSGRLTPTDTRSVISRPAPTGIYPASPVVGGRIY
ncbi:MAG TPA: magnetochrome domain-containing protein [Anaerolineae bacterium]|nr:magnetochrome domain-containing protein [Anaerolineae bacterium]